MDEATPSAEDDGVRFTVDLREIELTDEEVNSLQNQITKLAAEAVRQKGSDENAPGTGDVAGRRRPPREPYVRITFVKQIRR